MTDRFHRVTANAFEPITGGEYIMWCTMRVARTIFVIALLYGSTAHALTQAKLDKQIEATRQELFKETYRQITGKPGGDVGTLRLSHDDIREFVIRQSQMLSTFVDERAANDVCKLDPSTQGESDKEKKNQCLKDPLKYFRNNQLLSTVFIVYKKGVRDKIFDSNGRVKGGYAVQVNNSLIKNIHTRRRQPVKFENLDQLINVPIPVVGVKLSKFLVNRNYDRLSGKIKRLKGTKPTKSALTQLSDHISIRGSYLNPKNIAKPAAFGVTHFGGGDNTKPGRTKNNVGNFNGAVTWLPLKTFGVNTGSYIEFLGVVEYRSELIVGVESQVVTDQDSSTITHFVGGEFLFTSIGDKNQHGFLGSSQLIATLTYKTDRKYRADIFGVTAQWTPDWHKIGWGQDLFLENENLDVIWRPYIDFTLDNINDVGILPKTTTGKKLRIGSRIRGSVTIYDRFSIIPEIKYVKELNNDKDGHLIYIVSGVFTLDKAKIFSLNVGYKKGEEAPIFAKKSQFSFGLGVKF